METFCFLDVRLSPGASSSRFLGWHEKQLKVCVQQSPVDNKANLALIALVAKILKVSKLHVEIIKGAKSKNKTLKIHGLNSDQLKNAIDLALKD